MQKKTEQRERSEDATLLALRMQEGTPSQEPPEHGNVKKQIFPLEPPEGAWTC